MHKETSEAATQFILQPQYTADPHTICERVITNAFHSCSNFMQAVDYLRVMKKHNKFASYFASLHGSGSNDLGLQGGSNINAMWSSELAARCVLTRLFVWVDEAVFQFTNSVRAYDYGGRLANYLQTDNKTKMHQCHCNKEGIQAVYLSN